VVIALEADCAKARGAAEAAELSTICVEAVGSGAEEESDPKELCYARRWDAACWCPV